MKLELSRFAVRLRERLADWPAAGDDSQFESLALELFALQFRHNAAYQKICAAQNRTPPTVAHWAQIPFVPTAAFKELELTCLPPGERAAVFHSSGTTEQKPSRHFHNAESLAVYEASLWTWFASVSGTGVPPVPASAPREQGLRVVSLRAGRRDACPALVEESGGGIASGNPSLRGVDRRDACPTTDSPGRRDACPTLIALTPPPEQAPHSSLVHMFETIRQKLNAPKSIFAGQAEAASTWTLNFPAALALLSSNPKLETPAPKLVLGTAFSFVHLLDGLAENKLRLQLPAGSRVMETGGYKNRSRALPKAELYALITEHLGVPRENIFCEYGMSELSSQAYDVTGGAWQVASGADAKFHPPSSILHPRVFRFPPWARAQVVSPETGREAAEGETGLLRVLDLANVFSVAALQTEDLAVRRGTGFELLGRAAAAEPRGCSLMTV